MSEIITANGNGHDPDIKRFVGDFGPRERASVSKAAIPQTRAELGGVSAYEELGRTGLRHWGGFVFEEWLRELQQGRRAAEVFREMQDSDPVIGSIMYAIQMLIRRTSWWAEPKGSQEAEWLEGMLHDMSTSWADTIGEIISFLGYGYSYHELNFKLRKGETRNPQTNSKFNDGQIGLANMPIRSQDSLWKWVFDDDGTIRGLIQNPPPDYLLRFIPIEKAAHFRTTVFKDNPEGRSILRNAYRPWYFKRNLENIEGIGVERDLAGLPVLSPPEGVDIWDADDPAMASVRQQAQSIVSSIRRDEQEGVILPFGWELTLLSTGGRRQFDAQPLWAQVLTPAGWRKMGEIAVGDEIICPLGLPSRVEGVFPKGKRPIYKITTTDGRVTYADHRHRWVVTDCKLRRSNTVKDGHHLLPNYKIMTTAEMAERMERTGNRLHLPPLAPVEYETAAPLPLDPYLLGVFIGDGYVQESAGPRIYSADPEIIENVRAALPSGDEIVVMEKAAYAGRAKTYRISGTVGRRQSKVKAYLRQYELVGKIAQDKAVPPVYLTSSVEDRVALLQGLLDTDGTVDCNGFAHFITTSARLHLDVLTLIRSLGGSAGTHIRQCRSYRRPSDGREVGIDSTHYHLKNIRLPEGMAPFRLTRKLKRLRPLKMTYHRAIKTIEFAGYDEVQCILVSSPSHMYVTDDFIPTHNTNAIIGRYDNRIATSVLADMVLMGQDKVGSYALAVTKKDLFAGSLEAYLDIISSVFATQVIPRLWRLNGFTMPQPTLKHGSIETIDLDTLSNFVMRVAGAGGPFEWETIMPYLIDQAGMPQPSPDFDYEAAMAQAQIRGPETAQQQVKQSDPVKSRNVGRSTMGAGRTAG